eukprot:GHUV01041248.1.p1 GENE.GHUV01041248.1~~GHUV01041248.1.p1  ORF type:complete len:359 (+),score=139.27 GHUV01041248.1:184-1260(+)
MTCYCICGAAVTGLASEHAAEVLQLAKQQVAPGWRLAGAATAAELLNRSISQQQSASSSTTNSSAAARFNCCISTGSTALDALLGGGGVACGTVTEFFGVPGVGKTQVGMQLAVNAQIPAALGGLGAMAICIDTEGSFMTDRLIDMASAAVKGMQQQAAAAAAGQEPARQAALQQAAQAYTVDSILRNILYFRVQHYAEQLAVTRVLDLVLQQHEQVALLVIDSVTFHFRQDFPDAAQRQRLMTRMAQQLAALAEKRNIAVVMMNQVVTRIAGGGQTAADTSGPSGLSSSGTAAWLAPALGEGWGQAAACRVALFWEGSQRYALLAKAKHRPVLAPQQQQPGRNQLYVPYQVTTVGIR